MPWDISLLSNLSELILLHKVTGEELLFVVTDNCGTEAVRLGTSLLRGAVNKC